MTEPMDWIREELESLWSDLGNAELRSLAPAGQTSMRMENLMDRIVSATKIVGPISWKNVSITMIASGNYRKFCERMGITFTYPNDVEYARDIAPYMKQLEDMK